MRNLLPQGEAKAMKRLLRDEEEEVYRYKVGDYFGELSLIHDQPRAASVVAVGPCTCVRLDRGSFERLLGPCQQMLVRSKSVYEEIEARLKQQVGGFFVWLLPCGGF